MLSFLSYVYWSLFMIFVGWFEHHYSLMVIQMSGMLVHWCDRYPFITFDGSKPFGDLCEIPHVSHPYLQSLKMSVLFIRMSYSNDYEYSRKMHENLNEFLGSTKIKWHTRSMILMNIFNVFCSNIQLLERPRYSLWLSMYIDHPLECVIKAEHLVGCCRCRLL